MAETRRLDGQATLEDVIRVVNDLADMVRGNRGGRMVLAGDDGVKREIQGGATISTGEPALKLWSASGTHLIVYHSNGTGMRLSVDDNGLNVTSDLAHSGNGLGLFGAAVTTKKTVTGSRGGNAALASLLTALSNYGAITDSSS